MRPILNGMRSPALLILPLALAGCALTQSPFARNAGDTGSSFAAAATTLAYAHEGKLTTAYARASFVNYQSELAGVGQQFSSLAGSPGGKTVRRLVRAYHTAEQAVQHPCLGSGCNWRGQVAALNRASKAFVKAGGG